VAGALAEHDRALGVRLTLVIGRLERGGSERQIVELVRAAHPEHARCTVICLQEPGPLAPEVRACGARVIALGATRLYTPRALWRLARTLRREHSDVVYAFLFWGYGLALPLAALVCPGACRIEGRRSLPDLDVPGWSGFRGLRRLADRCAHGAIVNSLAVGSAVAAREPRLAGRLWVVPNGVRLRPPARRSHRDVLEIVCVANLIAYKGHATLIEALRRLPEEGWRLRIVGDGPERATLEAKIAADGLGSRVTLLGRRDDVDAILDTSDLLVLPSYSEGLPNAVMEAMACGLPVVASDVGGTGSLLGSGAGLLVPPRDPEALAAALTRMIEDPALRAGSGERGQEMIASSLSIEAMHEAKFAAIREICASRTS
jgi:glycosyltransferase involved in cell wall biosynthesis